MIDQKLILEGTLLKPNMVTPGASCEKRANAQEIAWTTVRTLSRSIVPALCGVVFLSGGQSEVEASENLNEMNKLANISKPCTPGDGGVHLDHSDGVNWFVEGL